MRFQLWGLVSSTTGASPGVSFVKLDEGATLAALLGAFRGVLTNGSASRLFLIDTTNNTVTPL